MKKLILFLSIISITMLLSACVGESNETTGGISFETIDNQLEVKFSGDLNDRYEQLLDQLKDINQTSKVAVITTSTANLFHELNIKMDAVPTSLQLHPELLALINNNELRTIGNAYQLNLEVLTDINPDIIFMADSLDIPEALSNYKVIALPQSTYYDIFLTLSLLEHVFEAEEKVQPILKSISEEHLQALASAEEITDNPSIGVVQFIFGQIQYNSQTSLIGSILSLLPVENVFATQEGSTGTLNLELLLTYNPDIIIVHGFGDNPDEALQVFLAQIRDEEGLWQTLDAVKNNQIIILGSALIGPSSDTRVTKSILEIVTKILEYEQAN